jgi:predicted Zn-dependent peptidase
MRPIVCAWLGVTLASSIVAAQKQSPPPPGPPVPFSLPEVSRDELANGLSIRLVPYGDVPKVSVRLVIQTGNIDEEPTQVWLADLMGDLMQQGTTTLTAQEVAAKAARMGGALDVGAGMNQLTIGGDVLSEFGAEMVALIGAVARYPAFPASELPRLKKDMLRRLSIARSEPRQLAIEKFQEVLYPGHPYGRLFPSADAVNGYSREDISRFYSHNVGADRAALYVVGRFTENEVRGAIRQAFETWKRGSPPTVALVKPHTERAIHIVDRPGAVQSTIYMGNPVIAPTDPDYVPLLVTNALLGGYFSSRVTSNLREEKGYAYSPFSTINSRLGTSYFAEMADVSTAVTGPSLKEIVFEIDRLQSMPPSAAELKAVQNYLSGTFVLQNSLRAGIIAQLAFLDLHGLGEDYLRRFVQRVNALTPADIQKMARQHLRDHNMTIVVVGDRAAIAKQVEPYGPTMPARLDSGAPTAERSHARD